VNICSRQLFKSGIQIHVNICFMIYIYIYIIHKSLMAYGIIYIYIYIYHSCGLHLICYMHCGMLLRNKIHDLMW
jgi:hypothetical protein